MPCAAVLPMAPGEIHVWAASLSLSAPILAGFRSTLAADEVARADRFIRRVHGDRFTAARGILRVLLGGLLGCSPGSVRFEYNDSGKPRLAPRGDDRIRFNVSHSAAKALFAFGLDTDLGVDIESMRPRVEHEKLAERFFAPGEVERLMALPEGSRLEAFYHCWSCKEAYIKARGRGIGIGLSRFEVDFAGGDGVRLLWVDDAIGDGRDWRLTRLDSYANFSGALAHESDVSKVRRFAFVPAEVD